MCSPCPAAASTLHCTCVGLLQPTPNSPPTPLFTHLPPAPCPRCFPVPCPLPLPPFTPHTEESGVLKALEEGKSEEAALAGATIATPYEPYMTARGEWLAGDVLVLLQLLVQEMVQVLWGTMACEVFRACWVVWVVRTAVDRHCKYGFGSDGQAPQQTRCQINNGRQCQAGTLQRIHAVLCTLCCSMLLSPAVPLTCA
jgi:hypothetical protein